MSFRGMAFLAGTTLALLNIPACGARGGGGNTIITETDSGTPPVDTGVAPVDTGVAPVDTGTPRVDTGVAPTCAAPRMTCDGACVDVRTDLAHCGTCAQACSAGQYCAGALQAGGAKAGLPAGKTHWVRP